VRCAAIVERAKERAGLAGVTIEALDILPPERDTVSLGGTMVAIVRFHLADGTSRSHEFWCSAVGTPNDRACSDDPRLEIFGGVDLDVPCSGPAPDFTCATPPPLPRPASVAAARALELPRLDVPLDHVGAYKVEIGEAGLPDGYLTTRSARLGDNQPTDFWLRGPVILHVEPTDPSRPPVGSRYREPFDGVESVRVFLVFEIMEFSPGALLQVRDIVVA
jgi:hypothetical protein